MGKTGITSFRRCTVHVDRSGVLPDPLGPAQGLAHGRLWACVKNGGRGRGRLRGKNKTEPVSKDEGGKTGSTRGTPAELPCLAFLHSHSCMTRESHCAFKVRALKKEPGKEPENPALTSCWAPQSLREQLKV